MFGLVGFLFWSQSPTKNSSFAEILYIWFFCRKWSTLLLTQCAYRWHLDGTQRLEYQLLQHIRFSKLYRYLIMDSILLLLTYSSAKSYPKVSNRQHLACYFIQFRWIILRWDLCRVFKLISDSGMLRGMIWVITGNYVPSNSHATLFHFCLCGFYVLLFKKQINSNKALQTKIKR